MRHISSDGLALIKKFEGFSAKAYRCPAGVLTVGFGHTSAAGEPKVTASMVVTEKQADLILKDDLKKFEARVENLVTVPLNDNQFATLVSFEYNTGALAKSTLLKKLNKGDYDAVPGELAKWVKATVDGKKVPLGGLINRRAAEAGLWVSGAQMAGQSIEVSPVAPPVIDKESITWGAGIAATLGSLFEGSGPVQWALCAVIIISFATGLYFFIRKRMSPT